MVVGKFRKNKQFVVTHINYGEKDQLVRSFVVVENLWKVGSWWLPVDYEEMNLQSVNLLTFIIRVASV